MVAYNPFQVAPKEFNIIGILGFPYQISTFVAASALILSQKCGY
jgi:hypothetical protein